MNLLITPGKALAIAGGLGLMFLTRKQRGSLLLLAPLGLLLVGCADSDPCNEDGVLVLRYRTTDFTPEELSVFPIVEADWNSFIGRRVLSLQPTTEGGTCVIVKDPQWGTGKAHLARTSKRNGIFELGTPYQCGSSKLPGVLCFQAMVAHEVGHMLGLQHVDDENALMFPKTRNASGPTEADREQCVRMGLISDVSRPQEGTAA